MSGAHLFRRIVFSAVLAGIVVGLLVSALELTFTVPLIREAEHYEALQDAATVREDHAHEAHVDLRWFTTITTILTAIGYACLLGAAMTLTLRDIRWLNGLAFGAAGFCAFQLAPALGLGIALPGTAQPDLQLRQLWWIATVVSTTLGIAAGWFGVRRRAGWGWLALCVLLVLAPHLAGAPQPDAVVLSQASVPLDLAQRFFLLSIAIGALLWILLGSTQAYLLQRWMRSPDASF